MSFLIYTAIYEFYCAIGSELVYTNWCLYTKYFFEIDYMLQQGCELKINQF